MGGRRRPLHEEGPAPLLAIRTDLKGKHAVRDRDGADDLPGVAFSSCSPNSSLSSLATSSDEQVNTHLSASSAGNTEVSYSALSATSTARTSNMSDDDRPSASSPMSPSPHAHPDITLLELISNSASSSALPDSFSFNVSRKGNYIAVYTSSNIWLIKASQLPRLWARTLEVKRKPVAIDITDDGTLLAVLSRSSQVDLYEIHGDRDRRIKKRRTISLVHEATSLLISPDGLILITGNKFGIEVVAIGPEAPETLRRSLTGPVGDVLEFSDDGRTLLITSYARTSASTSIFVLPGLWDGPLDDEGEPIVTSPESVWTGQMLFPETARIARQATLLPDADTGQVNELFAFNADDDTWGVYDIASQRFTQRRMFLPDQQRWTRAEFIDDAMPAVSPNADLAAVALRMRGTTSIWLYQIPEWDYKPASKTLEQSPIQPCFCIPILHENDAYQEIGILRWVKMDSHIQRLVAVGNLSAAPSESEGPSVVSGSKGLVVVLDFDTSKSAGGPIPLPVRTEFDLDPLCPGEKLPEGSIDFEREVELVRTRTLAQRRAQDRAADPRRAPGRANTTVNRDRPTSIAPPVPTITRDEDVELTAEEAQAAFDMPYDNQQPRSQMSLARAATVAAVSPANRRHLRALPFRPLEYRRADGTREIPHESDADNWVPPPPTYTETAEASGSVSLSHPNAPPVPANPAPANGDIPPVPALPSHLARPQNLGQSPYPAPGNFLSYSSIDLTRNTEFAQPSPPPQDRRPSLRHPSTYPSPQAMPPGRRRSSTSRSIHSPRQGSITHHQEQSAYQTTASQLPHRRFTLRTRQAPQSQSHPIDLMPPPILGQMARRGSAPDTGMHHRPVVPFPDQATRQTVYYGPRVPSRTPTRSAFRRTLLPRLSTFDGHVPHGPASAPPPRSQSAMARPFQQRPETRADMGEKRGSPKKKIGCVVM